MNFAEIFTADPMLIVESFTLILAFAYLARMLFVPAQHDDVNRRPHISPVRRPAESQISLLPQLFSFFGVGSLISLPKQSLRRQYISRQFAS